MKGLLAVVVGKWLAVEFGAAILAAAETFVAVPLATWEAYHTLLLFPFFAGLLLVPKSLRFARDQWRGKSGISPIWATILLVVITVALAAILYLLILYVQGHPSGGP